MPMKIETPLPSGVEVRSVPTRADVVNALETLQKFGRVGVADPPKTENRGCDVSEVHP
jgi:hypothetical protein